MENLRIHLGDGLADQRIILPPLFPWNGARPFKRGLSKPSDNGHFRPQAVARRLTPTLPRADAACAVFGGIDLLHPILLVHLGVPQARQQPGMGTSDQVSAVQLGRHLDVQREVGPRRFQPVRVRDRTKEVAAQANEAFHRTIQNTFAGVDGRQAHALRHAEVEQRFDLVAWHFSRVFGDTDRTLPLHVRVAAHRADARAGLADIAPQQQQVHQHLHTRHAMAVLGDTHAVDDHHFVRACVHGGSRFHGRAADAGLVLEIGPFLRIHGIQ